MEQNQTYLFTFIIPAYNCEDYVEEAILSVIEQDYGFNDHIQLILVNDGSTDGTGGICKKYASLFPQNISYIDQDNAGANAARAAGLSCATGDFVNFLDADDLWSLDVCSCMARFFSEHPEVKICTARHLFFGAREGAHALAYKFKADAVIDLHTTVDYPQLSFSNAFVARGLLRPELFETRLSVSEDFTAMNLILLDEMRYGIVTGPTYWYRKRDVGNSAIDLSSTRLTWYQDTPHYCYERLFDESKKRFGTVLPHLQYSVMYDLQWRIKDRLSHPLDDGQFEAYRNVIVSLLQDVDDEVIVAQRNMNVEQRLYVLCLKYRITFAELQRSLCVIGSDVFWRCRSDSLLRVSDLSQENGVYLDFIRREGDSLIVEGRFDSVFPNERLKIFAVLGGDRFVGKNVCRYDRSHNSFFEKGYYFDTGFVLEIPIGSKFGKIEFFVAIGDHVVNARMQSGKFCPISFLRFDFALFGDMALYTVGKSTNQLELTKRNDAEIAKREALYEANIYIGDTQARALLKYRRLVLLNELKGRQQNKEIWLISDRTVMAGDNGEALFRYLAEHPVEGVEPYFVINADSPDYARMTQFGKVVEFGSDEHIRLHLRASRIISSAGDDFVFNRLGEYRFLTKNFEHFKFVFLQHGVTKNDVSGWLNRYNKNISVFVTTSKAERDSILENPAYGYKSDDVVLSGFPRHDGLLAAARDKQPEKKVLIAPTWRENVAGATDIKTGTRAENPMFEQSGYYRFYDALLHDDRLAAAAREFGFEVDFLVHPALAQEAHKFSSSFANIATNYDYRNEFVTSSIMVTDYSSVAFDFALLKKPIVYAQFDWGTFYRDHPWERGYFSDKSDGFGDVCSTLDETVDAIVELMGHPEMTEKYRSRVDAFYRNDSGGSGRCQAVVDAIVALG